MVLVFGGWELVDGGGAGWQWTGLVGSESGLVGGRGDWLAVDEGWLAVHGVRLAMDAADCGWMVAGWRLMGVVFQWTVLFGGE